MVLNILRNRDNKHFLTAFYDSYPMVNWFDNTYVINYVFSYQSIMATVLLYWTRF